MRFGVAMLNHDLNTNIGDSMFSCGFCLYYRQWFASGVSLTKEFKPHWEEPIIAEGTIITI